MHSHCIIMPILKKSMIRNSASAGRRILLIPMLNFIIIAMLSGRTHSDMYIVYLKLRIVYILIFLDYLEFDVDRFS